MSLTHTDEKGGVTSSDVGLRFFIFAAFLSSPLGTQFNRQVEVKTKSVKDNTSK